MSSGEPARIATYSHGCYTLFSTTRTLQPNWMSLQKLRALASNFFSPKPRLRGSEETRPDQASVRDGGTLRERHTERTKEHMRGVHYSQISRLGDAGWMDAYTTTTMIIKIFSSWFLVFFSCLGSLAAAFGIHKATVGADLSWPAGTATVESLRTRVYLYEWWFV